MQLTSFTDYALRALIYMAALPLDKMTTISQIAEIFGASRHHMVKVINQLNKEGFIKASRGKNGGLILAKPAEQIRVGDVIRSLEPLSLVSCQPTFCHITSACRLKTKLNQAVEVFLSELDRCTIADLIKDNLPLYKLLLS